MLFNPLFIQSTGAADASSSIKQSKLNSPTYLFSDIIKIINKNTIGETPVTPAVNSAASTNIAEVDTTSPESMEQLLTLAQDESGTDNINISLNDLLKNLLISSNSEQVKTSGQVDNSSKKSTASAKVTSALSKADVEKLLQNLAASLLQLNISPDSLQQVLSANSGSDSTNKDDSGSNQSGNTMAELVINLSNDSKSTEISKNSTSYQSGALTSLYTSISSILTNLTNSTPSENNGKTLKDNLKTDSVDQKKSTNAEQLAAVLINLYQNNSSLVINVNSGDDTIKIEIPNNKTGVDSTNKVNSDDVPNAQDQADNSIKTNQKSVSEKTSVNAKETTPDNGAALAAAAVNKAKDSFFVNPGEVNNPAVVKTQTGPDNINIPDNKVIILSDQNNNVSPVSKSNTIDPTGLKSEGKVIVTVSSKLNNADSYSVDVKDVDETKAQPAKSSVSNIKISGNNETSDNTNASKGNEIKASNGEQEIVIKNDSKISDNSIKVSNNPETKVPKSKVKISENTDIKASDDKTVEDTEEKIKFSTVTKDPAKNALNVSAKTKNDIKNNAAESEQPDNTVGMYATAELKISRSSKEVTKETPVQGAPKANQINQAGAANRQPDNSSKESTDNTVAVKQSSTDEVAQVMNNNNQGNSFNDQPQKKSSDSSQNSDIKGVEQIASAFSTKATDSVNEKFLNQTSSTDTPEKTIRITEITKEITNIVQQNNSKSIVLQLKPESLGKMKVTVDVNNNTVSARVEVDTEAVKQIVQNNTTELRQSLSSNGMQLSTLSVNVSGGEQKPYQSFKQKKKSGYQVSDKRVEDNVSLASAKSLGYNTYEYLI